MGAFETSTLQKYSALSIALPDLSKQRGKQVHGETVTILTGYFHGIPGSSLTLKINEVDPDDVQKEEKGQGKRKGRKRKEKKRKETYKYPFSHILNMHLKLCATFRLLSLFAKLRAPLSSLRKQQTKLSFNFTVQKDQSVSIFIFFDKEKYVL